LATPQKNGYPIISSSLWAGILAITGLLALFSED